MSSLYLGNWFVTIYGPLLGGALWLISTLAVTYVGFLLFAYLDAPREKLENDNNDLTRANAALQAKLDAIVAPSIHVDVKYGFSQDPLHVAGGRAVTVTVILIDGLITAVTGSTFNPASQPFEVLGSRRGHFYRVRVIAVGAGSLTDVQVVLGFRLGRWTSSGYGMGELIHKIPIPILSRDDECEYEFFVANHTEYGVQMRVDSEAEAEFYGSKGNVRVTSSDLKLMNLHPSFNDEQPIRGERPLDP